MLDQQIHSGELQKRNLQLKDIGKILTPEYAFTDLEESITDWVSAVLKKDGSQHLTR